MITKLTTEKQTKEINGEKLTNKQTCKQKTPPGLGTIELQY
jgi:hypothetical protein